MNKVCNMEDVRDFLIKDMLCKDDKVVMKSLITLYAFKDKISFSNDKLYIISLTRQLLEKRYFTPKQLEYARKCVIRYIDQLLNVLNKEEIKKRILN